MTTRAGAPCLAVLAPHRPRCADDQVVWCATPSELAVLVRGGPPWVAVVDASVPGVDTAFVRAVRTCCPVALIGTGRGLDVPGVATLPTAPADRDALVHAAAAALAATWHPTDDHRDAPTHRAPLIAVVEAPCAPGAPVAAGIARALAATGGLLGDVLLADWTLDASHRHQHGLHPDDPGLLDLVAASRFGPTPPGAAADATHLTDGGYRVLPGLRRHADWITVSEEAAVAVLAALRAASGLVVVHVERDLEGERDTGSFDIEDRNTLARTAVARADLVVVAGGAGGPTGDAVPATLARLERFGVPGGRQAVVRPQGPRRMSRDGPADQTGEVPSLVLYDGPRADQQLGVSLRSRLRRAVEQHGHRSGTDRSQHDPERIEPGALGHWAQDVDGWMTPRVPQHP